MALKDLPADAQPREKLLARGPAALADAELLAILLLTGIVGKGVLQMAQELLDPPGIDPDTGAITGGVLVFHDQQLSDDHLLAFSRRFGELDPPPNQERGRISPPGYPDIYVVSNVLDSKGEPIGALEESAMLASFYRDLADEAGCGFFDAGSVSQTSPLDGIHLDAENTRAIGRGLEPIVRMMLGL